MAIKTANVKDVIVKNPDIIVKSIQDSPTSAKQLGEAIAEQMISGMVFYVKKYTEAWGSYCECIPWNYNAEVGTKGDVDCIAFNSLERKIGIALEENVCPFSQTSESLAYASYNYGYHGKEQTKKILELVTFESDNYAAPWCNKYESINFKEGSFFLPSLGEIKLAFNFFEEINMALKKIINAGKQKATLLSRDSYITSNSVNQWNYKGYDFSKGKGFPINKTYSNRVRPFIDLSDY